MYSIIKSIKSYSILAVALVFAGCALEEDNGWPEVNLTTVNISLDKDANRDSATAIDVLMIYDRDLTRAILKMRAKDYFASSQQIRRDYPDMVDVIHYELTPGQAIRGVVLPLRSTAPFAALVFADYATPGTHRIRVGTYPEINVRLRRNDFCIIEQGCDPVQSDRNYDDDEEITSAIRATLHRESGNSKADQSPVSMEKLVSEAEKDGAQVKKVSSTLKKVTSIFKQ
jgi:type VI secretion system protein